MKKKTPAQKQKEERQKFLEIIKHLEDIQECEWHIQDLTDHRDYKQRMVNELKKELRIK